MYLLISIIDDNNNKLISAVNKFFQVLPFLFKYKK
jgi:hypothetical protein